MSKINSCHISPRGNQAKNGGQSIHFKMSVRAVYTSPVNQAGLGNEILSSAAKEDLNLR